MGRMPWATHLWPGLSQLSRYGNWFALALAVGFTALVNLALMSTMIWSELLTVGVRNLVWVVTIAVWGVSVVLSFRQDRRQAALNEQGPDENAFSQVLDHYLKGNWFEAERILTTLLHHDHRDVDAGVMLAGVLRHTRRFDEALRQLERIERIEGSRKWEPEIERERELIAKVQAADSQETDESDESGTIEPNESSAGMSEAA